MGIRLYVGNLPFNVTEAALREHFSTIGPLYYLSIPTDRETGKHEDNFDDGVRDSEKDTWNQSSVLA
jgi:hypothetical protein